MSESKKDSRRFYQSPKSSTAFTKRWKTLCPEVMRRDNFKEAHLHTLELLCDLYVEYDNIVATLEVTGLTYEDISRNGRQVKTYPEVAQLNQLRTHIATYTKMLGFVLMPDKIVGNEKEKDEWD